MTGATVSTLLNHLWMSRQPLSVRLDLAIDIGLRAGELHVPAAIGTLGKLLRSRSRDFSGESVSVDSLRDDLLRVLNRLTEAQARYQSQTLGSLGHYHDVGYGIAAIAMEDPAGVGKFLADRIGVVFTIVPIGWTSPIAELSTQIRGQIVASFEGELDKRSGNFTEIDAFEAREALQGLRGEDTNNDALRRRR